MDSMKEKFWERVEKAGHDDCWIWTGGFCKGYGSFYYKGKKHIASRVAFQLSSGKIMPRMNILHSCDNPACCNPAHLSQGTQKKNITDAFKRGRLYANKVSKLDSGKVSFIRVLCVELNISHRKVAVLFGVNHRTVGRIMTGQYWAHS